MQPKYYVKEVLNEKDIAQAVSIWDRNLPDFAGKWLEKYNWFYKSNPYRKGKLWLLKLKGSEKAIGVGGVGYRRFNVNGKSLIGAMGVDFAVEKEYRTLGPALKLQKTIMESSKKNADFIYGFPAEQAEAVLNYFKFHKLGEFTRIVKVLKSGDYLERVIKPRSFARALSIPADLFLRLRSIKSLRASGNGFHSDRFQDSYSFYDRLWEEVESQGLLMGERTSKFLDWRYFKCPNIKYEIFGLKTNDKALQGCIVYCLGKKQVQVVDLICPGYEKENSMPSLIMNFEKYCFSIDANSICISLVGEGRVAQKLISMVYWKREQDASVWIYTGENKDLLAQFKDLENSCWTYGDLL